jgi:hypothetical protein
VKDRGDAELGTGKVERVDAGSLSSRWCTVIGSFPGESCGEILMTAKA